MDAGPNRQRLRVLHTPAAVGGHPQGLAEAERDLGVDSRLVALEPPPFGLRADQILFAPGASRAARELTRWRFLRRVLREFDVVHFNFGSSLLPRYFPPPVTGHRGPGGFLYGLYTRAVQLRDLPLLRRAGKGIVVTYQGDDARQGDALVGRLGHPYGTELLRAFYTPELDRRKRRAIEIFDRYAHTIFAVNPDLLHVLPERAEFLPYASVDPAEWQPAPAAATSDRPPVVVHAPSDRRAKGTRFVVEAVEELQARRIPVQLELVEGLAHDAAQAVYRGADLFVDQLIVGWYGTAAVELMSLGKPVVAYVREEDLGALPEAMRAELPVISATTATLADVLEEWLTRRRTELAELGRRSRSYVERWHDPRRIAERTKAAYEESVTRARSRR